MIFLTNLGENDKFLQFFHKARIFGETILPYFRLDYDTLCNIWFLKKYLTTCDKQSTSIPPARVGIVLIFLSIIFNIVCIMPL